MNMESDGVPCGGHGGARNPPKRKRREPDVPAITLAAAERRQKPFSKHSFNFINRKKILNEISIYKISLLLLIR